MELATWSRTRARKKKKTPTTSRARSTSSMKRITITVNVDIVSEVVDATIAVRVAVPAACSVRVDISTMMELTTWSMARASVYYSFNAFLC
jgi:hypothetical protein